MKNYHITPAPLKTRSNPPLKLVIPQGEGSLFVPTEELLYLEADGNYTFLYLCGGKRLLVCRPLQALEQVLFPLPGFVRVHRSYLINMAYVSSYTKTGKYAVELCNGKTISIAESRQKTFLEAVSHCCLLLA